MAVSAQRKAWCVSFDILCYCAFVTSKMKGEISRDDGEEREVIFPCSGLKWSCY